jgi:hypothetical protein
MQSAGLYMVWNGFCVQACGSRIVHIDYCYLSAAVRTPLSGEAAPLSDDQDLYSFNSQFRALCRHAPSRASRALPW